jgi:hypothetical protein
MDRNLKRDYYYYSAVAEFEGVFKNIPEEHGRLLKATCVRMSDIPAKVRRDNHELEILLLEATFA